MVFDAFYKGFTRFDNSLFHSQATQTVQTQDKAFSQTKIKNK